MKRIALCLGVLLLSLSIRAEDHSAPPVTASPGPGRLQTAQVQKANSALAKLPEIASALFQAAEKKGDLKLDLAGLRKSISAELARQSCKADLEGILAAEKAAILSEFPEFVGVGLQNTLWKNRPFRVLDIKGVAEESLAAQPLKHFKEKYGEDSTNVRLIIVDQLPGRIASFIPPASSQSRMEWPVQQQVKCASGKQITLQFESYFELQGTESFDRKLVETVFGSPYIILVAKATLQPKNPAGVESVLAHELRHYLDFVKTPELFKNEATTSLALERALREPLAQALGADKTAFFKSPKFESWYSEYLRFQSEQYNRPPKEIDSALRKVLEGQYDQAAKDQLSYLYHPVEERGHREQIRYLSSIHKMSPAQIAGTFRSFEEPPLVSKDRAGKNVTLSLPELPLVERYIEFMLKKE